MRSPDRWGYVYLVQEGEVDRGTQLKELTRVKAERHAITTKRMVEGKHTRPEIDFVRVERLVKGVLPEVVRLLEIGRVGRCQVK